MTCPKCKSQLPAGAIACAKCGARFKTEKCPKCGKDILAGSTECIYCHKKIKQDAAAQATGQKASPNAGNKKPITKQWWFWTVCVVLVIGIIGNIGNAINGSSTPSRSAKSSSLPANPTPEPGEENVFLAATVHEMDVMNGTKTKKIGTWAYIEISKAEAKSASPDEYVDFVSQEVQGSGYNWFSILFEDNTGVQFPGSYTYLATYGELDDEGCITEAVGDISLDLKSGKCSYNVRPAENSEIKTDIDSSVESSVSPTPTATPTNAPQESADSPGTTPEQTSQPTEHTPEPTPAAPDFSNTSTPSIVSTPQPISGTVCWTPNGEKYHNSADCVSLKRSSTILHGTLEEAVHSGHDEPCKLCH